MDYVGNELEAFARAHRWKRYWASQLPLRGAGDVLEVGAGLGGSTRVLCDGSQRRWVCLEPDRDLAAAIDRAVKDRELPPIVETRVGTIADLADGERFDWILYVDVLEHIEDDAAEAARAARHLAPGGRLAVLAPAHEWLYSPFDRAVGHHRRYTKATLRAAIPRELECEKLVYLDAVGMAASLANRVLLRSAMPTARQLDVWDRVMVPLSRAIDPLLGRRVGKSVLGVWRSH